MGLTQQNTEQLRSTVGPQRNSCRRNKDGECGAFMQGRATGLQPDFCGTDGKCYIDDKDARLCNGNPVFWKMLNSQMPDRFRKGSQ